jgi:hypothetical protein
MKLGSKFQPKKKKKKGRGKKLDTEFQPHTQAHTKEKWRKY